MGRWVLEEVPGGLIAQLTGEWDVGDWHFLLNGRLLINRVLELRYPECCYWVELLCISRTETDRRVDLQRLLCLP